MRKIDKETLKLAANRLMFELSDEEIEKLLSEFDVIVNQMNLIGEIDGVDEVTPMTFPFDCTNSYLREDVAGSPTDREILLSNSKDVVDGQIRLPRVVK